MKSSKGFTLIELIIVMAVFLFIIGAALGIFISIIQNQKKILVEQQFLNQISYVEEYMSKALRMAKTEKNENCLGYPGYIYLLTRYDSASETFRGIKFLNQSNDTIYCQEFFLDNTTDPAHPVLKEIKNGIEESKDIPGTEKAVALTPPNLQISSIRFSVNGSDGSASSNVCPSGTTTDCGASDQDSSQPRVTILLNVTIPGDNQGTATRTIQTTVSRRNLNVKY